MFAFLAQAASTAGEQVQNSEQDLNSLTNEASQRLQNLGNGLTRGEVDTESLMFLVTKFVVPTIVVLLALLVAYLIGSFLRRIIAKGVGSRVDETLGKFLGKLVFWAIMVFAFLGVLGYFGISVAAFAAVIAAAGFAVGLAFQGTLSSFAAGVMILVFRPFKVGQVVNVAGVLGKVDEIDLFATTFDTFDNRRIIVPNNEIFGSTIENISYHGERRVDVNVGAEYSADIDATRAALNKAAESIEGVIQGEGRGYQVMLLDLGDSSVNWVIRIWVPAADFWTRKEELTRAVKMQLDQAGIGIPFPQMDVHLDGKLVKEA